MRNEALAENKILLGAAEHNRIVRELTNKLNNKL